MQRFRNILAAAVCCAFISVFLTGCKGDNTQSGPGGNGLTSEARKAKKGDE